MRRIRWVRYTIAGLVVGFVLFVAGFFYQRHSTRQEGQVRLAAVTAHLDETDPRWRIDDIDADRGWLNDDQNSTLLIPRFKAALASKDFGPVRPGPNREDVFIGVPPNHVLDDEAAAALDAAMLGNNAALAIARSFKDYPRGLRRYPITPDWIGTLLPGLQETRWVVAMLDTEAERLCRDGRPGAALELVRGMLNAARSVDGEPFLVSVLVRIAGDASAANRVERILGLTTPRGGLAELQSMLLAEADADLFFAGVRGERAGIHLLFTNLQSGQLPIGISAAIAGAPGSIKPSAADHVTDWAYEPHLAGDHATYLETVTKVVELRQLPEHQQRAALKAIPVPPKERGTLFTSLLFPIFHKVHDAQLRSRAQLRCAATALAAERFRQRHGRWPSSLAEIPKDVLAAVPLDPFDGTPLKYVRRADGVTVYSVGQDEKDDGGNVQWDGDIKPGTDVGIRLFDLSQRGLPSIPRTTNPTRLFPVPDGADDPGTQLGPPPRDLGPS